MQKIRNTALDEGRCSATGYLSKASQEDLASAIRAMKQDLPAAAGASGLPDDVQLVLDKVRRQRAGFQPGLPIRCMPSPYIYEPHKVQEGELRNEAIQTAAMALRFLASLSRYGFAQARSMSSHEVPLGQHA